MPIAMTEYLEVNLIGVVLLLIMLFFTVKKHAQEPESRHFVGMLVLNALILLLDNGIYLLRGHGTPSLIFLNHCICMAYFILHGWFGYEWVRYVLLRLSPRNRLRRRERAALLAPASLNTLLVLLTPLTGWVYRLTESNVYQRGSFVWISFAAAIFYWAVGTAIVLREWLHPTRSRKTGEYLTLLIFPALLVFGNVLQLRFYGLSIVWIWSAICMLILFIDIQNELLSHDELTGMFNRRQTDAQLLWEAGHLHSGENLLFVAMLDIDHFKRINDTRGHLAGDQALAAVARALRENSRRSDFAGRYGGDEFVLIGHVKRPEEAEQILRRIEKVLDTEKRDFPLTVSAGCAVFRPEDPITVDSMLGEADRRMYETKRRKKAERSGA